MNAIAISNVDVYYGKASALEGVSVVVPRGEITGLLGRNGAGKTTLLNALMGLLPMAAGQYTLGDRQVQGWAAHELARAGVSLVPADRQIYGELTVLQNLQLAHLVKRSGAWTHARVFDLFPRLKERQAGLAENLSGGEKQMLAIGRALLTNPDVLLMDEPTEGLAPLLVQEVVDATRKISREGISVLVVEQNLKAIAPVLNTVYVLESGRIAWQGVPADLMDDIDLSQRLLGV
jgi:branched-chain amino acid transport system ATP-binding protein